MRPDKWLSEVEARARTAGHFRVQDLINLMKASEIPISRATLYRAVNKLLKAGKIMQVSSARERYFEFVNEQTHYHFRCKNCGRVVEFFFADIEKSIRESAKKLAVLLTEQNLVIEGFCNRCYRRKNAGRKRLDRK
ncbi:MAG: transcriptional repressor [Candidatus Omnitrophica bacterium]|nr:transcriptional repressor [Candidatus Omnitrophota bacterium]MCM8825546.1 transcriptional repressor [Candidatus Omnitrophota bacterium]